jgi:oligopeptide transport system substrate-binding protein
MQTRLALVLFLVVLAGCHRGGDQPNADSNTLRYPITLEPPTLDPARLNDIYITEMLQNVYEGLVTFDAQNRVIPALAEKWDVSSDAKTYTFHLRPDVSFHNGRTVTAEDFRFSFERALRPETLSPTAANYLGGILGASEFAAGRRADLPGVRAVDERTLVITLKRPAGYFLGCLTYPCAWAVCKEVMPDRPGSFGVKSAIGAGAFRLTEYRPGSRLVMEAHEKYWGGRPKLDRIERPIVLDQATAHSMYETGEVDAYNNLSVPDYAVDVKDPVLGSQTRLVPGANIVYLVMHPRLQPVFRDVRVRRAFAMAIDREQISALAYHGSSPAAYSFVPPGMAGSNPNIRKIAHDPVSARRLLAEAGFSGGKGFPQITLEFAQKQREVADAALFVRGDLKKHLGIEVDLREREMGSFFSDTGAGERIPFFITGWIADYLDPQDFLSTMLRTGAPLNHVGYSNPAFDRLCDEADGLSDMAKRIPLYQQADQIAMDEAVIVPLVVFNQPQLVKPYVKNLESNLMLPMLPHRRTEVVR